jgi:hypothetical protein
MLAVPTSKNTERGSPGEPEQGAVVLLASASRLFKELRELNELIGGAAMWIASVSLLALEVRKGLDNGHVLNLGQRSWCFEKDCGGVE